MINIVKKELEFDDELKKKIEFICGFCNTTPTIINGSIRKVDKTNLSYSNEICINNLSKKIKINELENILKDKIKGI